MYWLNWLLKPFGLKYHILGVHDIMDPIMGKEGRPDTPDYLGAARDTGQSNLQSALIQAVMNRPNEYSPLGQRTWSSSPSGLNLYGIDIPTYTSQTQFTPAGQERFDIEQAMYTKGGQGVNDIIGTDFDISGAPTMPNPTPDSSGTAPGVRTDFGPQPAVNTDFGPMLSRSPESRLRVEKALHDRAMRTLRPRFEMERDDLRTDLVNRGFSLGNEGYEEAQDNLYRRQDESFQDSVNRSILAGGAEESRIFGLDKAIRDQMVGEDTRRFGQEFDLRNQRTGEDSRRFGQEFALWDKLNQRGDTQFGQGMDTRRQYIAEKLLQRQLPFQEFASARTGAMPTLPQFQNYTAIGAPGGADYLGGMKSLGNFESDMFGKETDRSQAIGKFITDFISSWTGGKGVS